MFFFNFVIQSKKKNADTINVSKNKLNLMKSNRMGLLIVQNRKFDTTAIRIMASLTMTLLLMTILVTLRMGYITYNDITCN